MAESSQSTHDPGVLKMGRPHNRGGIVANLEVIDDTCTFYRLEYSAFTQILWAHLGIHTKK
jgi:hypothetical protein